MKVSDYVLKYLKDLGVNHAFLVTGGALAFLVDAFDKNKNLEYVCTTQEQGAAMAAEAYSRITENIGVAMATSGPGATNLMTGIGCAYFDSIPTLYITGQVNTYESTTKDGPRQIGFQETNVVDIVKPITKFSAQVTDPGDIKYLLDKAVYLAESGRPGPVLLDLPMDIQRVEIDPAKLKSYTPKRRECDYALLDKKVEQTIDLIQNAKRPVIILGAGVKLAKAREKTRDLIERLGIPVALSWGAIDVLPYDHPLLIEGFGVSANRAGNFAVQNADLIISLGSRLDSRQTGGRPETFARAAKKVVLDIDERELYKARGLRIDVDINYDINDFLENINEKIDALKPLNLSDWKSRIKAWKAKYPICLPEYIKQNDKVNPYVFMDALSDESKEADIIITDAGATLTWTMQGFKVKEGQRLFSAFGNSPMGYSLPASIGACFAANKKPITCIIGDGGFKMNVNELETIVRHDLPIKIFIINNHEFGIIRQFQDVWLNSSHKASCFEGGLGDSNLLKVAQAFGLPTTQINSHMELRTTIRETLQCDGPMMCNVEVKHREKIVPKLEFGKPIEDPSPLLSRKEFLENMIVEPVR
jgi:acetolactate synthase-1/2/3 large subunit